MDKTSKEISKVLFIAEDTVKTPAATSRKSRAYTISMNCDE
ncbi:MAG: hypothetical protein K9G49_03100 [Taibaiella sp.]|nr:hypothetical protein [Taibaiella sp.]